MNWIDKNVFKCISGENEGKSFVYYDHDSLREFVNGKVNRYPYFSLSENEIVETNQVVNPYIFNIQLKEECKNNNSIEYNALRVIAKRIIEHDIKVKNNDQYKITSRESTDKLGRYITMKVYQNQVAIFDKIIAEITYHYDTDTYYVIHKELHPTIKNSYGHTMKETFEKRDHWNFGYKYTKPVYASELEEYKNWIR